MNDVTNLKSFQALRSASELLGIHLPLIWTPVEENYIVGEHGVVGVGFTTFVRHQLFLAERHSNREHDSSVDDILLYIASLCPRRGMEEVLKVRADYLEDRDAEQNQ